MQSNFMNDMNKLYYAIDKAREIKSAKASLVWWEERRDMNQGSKQNNRESANKVKEAKKRLNSWESAQFIAWYEYTTGSGYYYSEHFPSLPELNEYFNKYRSMVIVAIFPVYDSEWVQPHQ